MKKPAWFAREVPRDWGRDRVNVDGDQWLDAAKMVLKIVATCIVAGVFVTLVFCLSNH